MRLRGLPSESAWAHCLYPVDPDTGERARREPITVLDDDGDVDAFFARQAG